MSLQETTRRHSDTLCSAGYALKAIGNLLGADGCEHHLDTKLENGLLHAVYALGAIVLDCALDLSVASEPEPAEQAGEVSQ